MEITLIGYDVEGNISDYKIETEPLYGTVSITQGEVTYTHLGGGEEEDYLYYVVSDGVTESEVGEVVIEIIQENDAPTLSTYVEAEVEEGSSVNIGLDVYDEEGDTLNYTIITEPTYGEYSFRRDDIKL